MQRLRVGVLAATIVTTLLTVTGCASGSAKATSSDSSAHYVAFGVSGGEYKWLPPRVTPAEEPGGRPMIAAGAGRDPVTGSTMFPVVQGTGAVLTDPSKALVRYVEQSWDGKHTAHDSWRSPGHAEAVGSADPVAAQIHLALTQARVGDLIEIVAPASVVAVAGQSAVIVIAVEAG
jgi:hypothetical protein